VRDDLWSPPVSGRREMMVPPPLFRRYAKEDQAVALGRPAGLRTREGKARPGSAWLGLGLHWAKMAFSFPFLSKLFYFIIHHTN
jgi:hypothetical protein